MVDLLFGSLGAIIWGVDKVNCTWSINNSILALVLITISVSTNDDWLGPPWHKSWNVRDDNWLSENSSIKNVSNGSIWGFPHLLQVEFGNSLFIWGDSGALNSYLAFGNGVGGINGDLIVSGISVFNGEIEVLAFKVKIRVNVLFDV